jgi:hypothetical protein
MHEASAIAIIPEGWSDALHCNHPTSGDDVALRALRFTFERFAASSGLNSLVASGFVQNLNLKIRITPVMYEFADRQSPSADTT